MPPATPSDLDANPFLKVDRAGLPIAWLNWHQAVGYYVRELVAWTVGEPTAVLHGGRNRLGRQTVIELHPVIAVRGADASRLIGRRISLNNDALFRRDRHVCLYCGLDFPSRELTRDHVVPLSRGGRDVWENVVCACLDCNRRKANRTPEEAVMPLLALPYAPSYGEGLLLEKRRIVGDQMVFLTAHLGRRGGVRAP